MHPRFAEAVRHLYPNATMAEVLIQDDGSGPYIKTWTLPNPPPTDAQVIALIPTLDAPKLRENAFLADSERSGILAVIKDATPDQIRTYVNSNVTDLASARVMLRRILLLIAYMTRR